ncbi:hypothetical protein DY000_02025329 [Brassica cretica]|uniref:Uncharacterized protein n=1 Tax=Brassica cretica TaxID=69181 RepID=A0ABQ7EI26_BRACR|nr:hypothetical protein DY000_02025329 [Brassica cretica]
MSGKKRELDVLESRGEDEEKVERWESTEMGYGPRMETRERVSSGGGAGEREVEVRGLSLDASLC